MEFPRIGRLGAFERRQRDGGSFQLGEWSPGGFRGDETLQGVEVPGAQVLDAAALFPQLVQSGVVEPPFPVPGPRLLPRMRTNSAGVASHGQPSARTGAPRYPPLRNPPIGPAPPRSVVVDDPPQLWSLDLALVATWSEKRPTTEAIRACPL